MSEPHQMAMSQPGIGLSYSLIPSSSWRTLSSNCAMVSSSGFPSPVLVQWQPREGVHLLRRDRITRTATATQAARKNSIEAITHAAAPV